MQEENPVARMVSWLDIMRDIIDAPEIVMY
jgi:hypothetical protein